MVNDGHAGDTFVKNNNFENSRNRALNGSLIENPPLCMRQSVIMKTMLFLLFVILITAVIVLMVLYLKPSTKDEEKKDDVCMTPSCLLASSMILNRLNTSVDPCDNFYQFTCGKFIESTVIPDDRPEIRPNYEISDIIMRQFQSLLEESVIPADIKPVRQAKHLYRTCRAQSTSVDEQIGELLKIIKKLGGWPVLEGEKWQGTNVTWLENVDKFVKNGFNPNYFINIRITQDIEDTTKRMIIIEPPSVIFGHTDIRWYGINNNIYVKAYCNSMIDIALILGATNRTQVEKELEEVLKFDADLAYKMQYWYILNQSELYNPETIGAITKKWPTVPWLDYINTILSDTGVTVNNDTIIINPFDDYNFMNMEYLLYVIKWYSPRTYMNYAIWKAISELVHFMDGPINDSVMKFTSKVSGIVNRPSRWVKCVSDTVAMLPRIVHLMYIQKYFNDIDAQKDIIDFTAVVKNKFKLILKQSSWMSNEMKQKALQTMEHLSEITAYPNEIFNKVKLEETYKNLELVGDNYLNLIRNITIFANKYAFSQLRQPVNGSLWITPPQINSLYSVQEKQIYIPAALIYNVLSNSRIPSSWKYGAIGSILGQEMIHGFDFKGHEFEQENIVDWLTALAQEKCYNWRERDVFGRYEWLRALSRNLIAASAGLKSAYMAFNNLLMSKVKIAEPALPGMPYTPKQLFWISATNSWCSKMRPEYFEISNQNGISIPEERLTMKLLDSVSGWKDDFNCPVKNHGFLYKNKCIFW